MKDYHETADGTLIELSKLTDSHLDNIIAMIERKAKEGITISSYGGHGDYLEMWSDIEDLDGDEVLEHFDYAKYKKERKRRRKLTHK